MGRGGTAKKLQQMIDTAEQTYKRLNEMREQLVSLRETVEETGDRVTQLEAEQTDQRALLVALAEERGIDVDEVLGTDDATEGGDGTADAESPTAAQDNKP